MERAPAEHRSAAVRACIATLIASLQDPSPKRVPKPTRQPTRRRTNQERQRHHTHTPTRKWSNRQKIQDATTNKHLNALQNKETNLKEAALSHHRCKEKRCNTNPVGSTHQQTTTLNWVLISINFVHISKTSQANK